MADTKIEFVLNPGTSYITGDIHLGRKQFSRQKTTGMIDYLKSSIQESGCSNIFILGDIWDNRKLIDWSIFNEVNEFFGSFPEKKIVLIVGNHDSYYRNTVQENSIKYLELMYSNIKVIQNTEFIKFNSKNLLFVPWIVSEEDNNIPSDKDIKKADLVLGHFEFQNFEMMPGVLSSHGFANDRFGKKPILTGHYHISSKNNNIHYLGVCQQMSWSDFNTQKGHYILDENLKMTFVENIISERYIKIYYSSSSKKPIKVHGLVNGVTVQCADFKDLMSKVNLQHSNIKIYLENNTDKIKTQDFLVQLDMNQISYVLIDNTPEHNEFLSLQETAESENISDMIIKILDNSEHTFFKELYNEALALDEG